MSNVLQFPREPNFEFSGPQDDNVPEGSVIFAGLALTTWLPTIIWCSALNNNLPLDLVTSAELVGGIIGLLLYKYPPSVAHCVPAIQAPDVPTDQDYPQMPMAA